MIGRWARYVPAAVMGVGAIVTLWSGTPRSMPLVRPLPSVLPATFLGASGKAIPISADETQASGVTAYVNQGYDIGNRWGPVALYIGYHGTQQGDKGMHSPSVCLPGSGWTPVKSGLTTLSVEGRRVPVSRYVLQKGDQRILVYYWFQGRGRITTGEAQLKLNTLEDAFLHHRDEETLVRIIVPVENRDLTAGVGTSGLVPDTIANRLATQMIPAIQHALPPAP